MIVGRRHFLLPAMRDTLAQYLAYKLLVLDWLDEDPLIPAAHATGFYKTKNVPPGMNIWGFHCFEGRWQSDVETIGMGLCREEDWFPDLPKNTKSFAIGLGNLFVFAVASTFELDIELNTPEAVRLWPHPGTMLTWPPRHPIDSKLATLISQSVYRIGGK